jgi:hypothetical protein
MPLAVYSILTILGLAERHWRGTRAQDTGYRSINRHYYFEDAPPACELRLLACSIVDLK